MTKTCFSIVLSILVVFGSGLCQSLQAQNEEQEVFLQFRHQSDVNTYISSYFANDEFYLSVHDLFTSLQIDVNTDQGNLVLQGNYLGKERYIIDFNNHKASFGGREHILSADDFIISELGYYLKPGVFERLLELEFIIDFNNLSVRLETDETMPVTSQRERERRRERLSRTQNELSRTFEPLEFGRNPSLFNGGFLDYNLTANVSQSGNTQFLYNTNIGTEVLGGDFQGAVFGSYSQTSSTLRSSGLRWRYGIRDSPWISTITAGQSTSGGQTPVAYTGIKLTNEPIEPRYLYGETAFTGSAPPNSEVELYRNNTLVDFAETDESGSYRFVVPLTYGSSQYNVRIYSSGGQMIQRDVRLQIPYHFLPPGEVTYNLNTGRLDNPLSGSTERGLMSKADLTAGITSWLTASGGVEYFEDFHDKLPAFHGTLSSRFFTNYLISLETANAFYRVNASVIYPSSASLNLDYIYYNQEGGIYNPGRNHSSIRANLFTPFEIGSFPLFFRWSFTNDQRDDGSVFRYRADLNTRIGKANIRIGYRDTQLGSLSFTTTPVSRINLSSGYNFSRGRGTPAMLRGLFLRAQMNFIPSLSEIEDAELQISRNIFGRGRFHLSAGHNFIGGFNLFRFSLTFDFNRVRSSSSVRTSRSSSGITQSIRGSAGFDSNNKKMLLSNRQQSGRAGVAVRLYMDQNNNGVYDQEDELIPENAIRLGRAGGNTFSKEGVTYISQLQPYRRYNMSVNKSALNNPLLVPDLQNFSIVTDPNQYKQIEIPFYMTGVADGMINRIVDGEKKGLGGIRLFLNQVNLPDGSESYSEEIRTFSDGSFYAYELPPGNYQVQVDSSQLDFLNVHSEPDKLEFTIRSLANGDFAEGLEINLVAKEVPSTNSDPESLSEVTGVLQAPSDQDGVSSQFNIPVDTIITDCRFSVQTGSFSTMANALRASDEFNNSTGFEFEIYPHDERNLYNVRTVSTASFARAVEQAGFIQNRITDDTVNILNLCSDAKTAGEPLLYHIQLASFSSEVNARRFQEELINNFDSEVYIIVETENIFRIKMGPYYNLAALLEAFTRITEQGISDDAFVTYTPEYDWNQRLEFTMQAGLFSDDEQAGLYSTKLRSEHEISTLLVQVDNLIRVMIENIYETWNDIIQDYHELADNPANQKPIIYIKEK
ncbi:MAG: SPOR domain-containing protein [Balneolaceae bacterium]